MTRTGLFLALLLCLPAVRGAAQPSCADAEAEIARLQQADRTEVRQALPALREQLTACYETLPSDEALRLLAREASLLYRMQASREALATIERVLPRHAASADSTVLQRLHNWRGYLLYQLGRQTDAIGAYATALSVLPDSLTYLRVYLSRDIAVMLQNVSDFRGAEPYYRLIESLLPRLAPDNPAHVSLRADYEAAYADFLLQRATRTRPSDTTSLRQALPYAQRAHTYNARPERSAVRPKTYTLLGELYTHLADTAAALRTLRAGYAHARRVEDPHWESVTAWRLAELLLKRGDQERAFELLLEADRLMEAAGRPDRRQLILRRLGYAYELRGNLREAEDHYRRSIALTEQYRSQLGTTEWAAMAFGGRHTGAYRGLVRVLLGQQREEEAFLVLERSRARHLQDLRAQARALSSFSPQQAQQFDRLTAALERTRTTLARDTLGAADRARFQAEEARLIAERDALVDLDPAFFQFSMAALQQHLGERGQVLVSYFIDAETERPGRTAHSYAFVVTRNGLTTVRLAATLRDVEQLIERANPLLEAYDASSAASLRHFDLKALHGLHEALIAPLAGVLTDGAPVVILPDGPLHTVPFAALVREPVEPFAYAEAAYLVQDHALSVEVAAALLLADEEPQPSARDGILALGKARFADMRSADVLVSSALRDNGLPDLPAVRAEVGMLERLFWDVESRLDAEATEAVFATGGATAGVIHVASHAVINPVSPLHNAFILSPSPDGREDGILYLHELGSQPLGARLVVLSGCSTARGDRRGSEGMAGLQYGIRSRGVASAIATLWLVEDRSMASLMETFYRNLRNDLPKDEALRRAQLAYLSQHEGMAASPFYWAAPVLFGETDHLELTGRYAGLPPFGWGALGGLTALGLMLALVFRRRLS